MTVGHCCTENDESCHPRKGRWYRNKTLIVAAILALFIGISYAVPLLVPFRETLLMYFGKIWWATALGLVLGGFIEYAVPRDYVSRVLAHPRKRTVLHAVLIGFFMSVCSHGILALSMQLYKKGAATSSVVAFLLASPWANLPLTLILISFFGLVKALYLVISALIIAIVTGLIFQTLERKGWVESNGISVADNDFFILGDMKKRVKAHPWHLAQLRQDFRGIREGVVSLSDMVLWWILLGAGLASLAGAYIPEHFFHQYMGPTLGGMLITLAVATVIEVCSEGTAPLAFEIFRQTGAMGNALVFLMAGVATDYTEIGLLWANIGRRTALWLPAISVPQILLFGFLANYLF